jgi:hypothetical protein
MTHADLTLRILNGLFWSIGPYLYWRKQISKESERRFIQQRLDDVIRGGR